jgi:hypothetical protein
MNPEFKIKVGRKTYPILFNVYGMTKLERETGLTIYDLVKTIDFRIDPAEFQKASPEEQERMTGGALRQLGLYKLQALLYAGLEGGRRKLKPQDPPFDFDEVGELIEDAGGYMALAQPLILGYASFFPRVMGIHVDEPEKDSEKNSPKTRKKSTGKTS